MWKETSPSVSGFPPRNAQSSRFRRKTDSASTATARPDGYREEGYATNATPSSPTAHSLLSTSGLSNPTLAGISPRKVSRREAVEESKESEEIMPAGTSRDRSATIATYDHAAAAAMARSPVAKGPQSPLRRRPLSSKRNSAAETPSVPEPAIPRSPTLYDRLRRSIPNFSLSNPATPSQSRLPRSPRNNRSSGADPVTSPLSPKGERCEPEGTYAADAVQDDVKSPAASAEQSAQLTDVTQQKSRAGDGIDNGIEDYPQTPQKDDNQPNEDVFMSIARSESGRRGSSARSDAKRSRSRISGRGLQSPASQYHDLASGPDLLRFSNGEDPWDSNELPPVSHSAVGYSPASDQGRPRWNAGPSSKSAIGISQRRLGRAGQNASPRSLPASAGRRSSFHDPQPYGHLRLSTIRSIEQPSAHGVADHGGVNFGSPRPESAVSSAAPSAVWDELDEMKSRILKLELTGKLPPSSHDALSWTPERPRTSGTTATGSSASPRHQRKASNLSRSTTAASPIQTNLQSALAKGKHVLGDEVYKSLEATVTDALKLSALSGNPPATVSTVSSSKDIKQNADSLCRNLTTLCTSLSEEQPERQRSSRVEDSPTLVQVGESPTAPSHQRGGGLQLEKSSRRSSITRGDPFKSSRTRNGVNDGPPASYSNPRRNHSPEPQSPASRLSTPSRIKRPTVPGNESQNLHRRSNSTMTGTNTSRSAYRASRQSDSYDSGPSQSVAGSHQSPMSPALQQPKFAISRRSSLSQPGTPSRKSLIATTPRTPSAPRSGTYTVFQTPRYISSPTESAPENSASQQELPESRLPAPSSRLGMSYTPQYSRS